MDGSLVARHAPHTTSWLTRVWHQPRINYNQNKIFDYTFLGTTPLSLSLSLPPSLSFSPRQLPHPLPIRRSPLLPHCSFLSEYRKEGEREKEREREREREVEINICHVDKYLTINLGGESEPDGFSSFPTRATPSKVLETWSGHSVDFFALVLSTCRLDYFCVARLVLCSFKQEPSLLIFKFVLST